MTNQYLYKIIIILFILLLALGCNVPQKAMKIPNLEVPESYQHAKDTTNSGQMDWRAYYEDELLIALIDTALKNNQELTILAQEIEISRAEVRSRKGEYLPFAEIRAGLGLEKEGRYTRFGAVDEQLEIREGQHFPDPLSDVMVGLFSTWEIDIWKKLHRAKRAAASRYLASTEGRNFMVSQLIAEISESYFELMVLDKLLEILEQNVGIQSEAVRVVRQQKSAARLSQLAVNRFEAQLLNTKNLQYDVKQQIVEAENRLKFLSGKFEAPIIRKSLDSSDIGIDDIRSGIPAQLLVNRPDVRQAELELAAANLDVQVARANFLPSLGIKAGVGFRTFAPAFLLQPESILYNIAGDIIAPLVNRNAIKAAYTSASARQVQAAVHYEQTILRAYTDVLNQVSKVDNYTNSYTTKSREVDLLVESVSIANNLFNAARADYAEVLLTQREALEAKMDLLEIQLQQMHTKVHLYRSLGGGWN
ncbi:efflux transporter, outer membrane factor (OMF) lipoprotein, NodT family [Cyclobacterium lianum]|uniref:Efflux transporter, outer membrane factor (OMF) lipoprotein, NodT family n=1 Tax=Cyclobacterium lianum TaxID=388280 RepID=A0A1M7N2S3_9BACT|nr:efflux transporter outer membrane subunit [Cyclobacterium lianum]SHM97720.1 efflux transporter, outer membrane factor (OMF) lipoprotein, NodT family [Cyclobacterium lianum]